VGPSNLSRTSPSPYNEARPSSLPPRLVRRHPPPVSRRRGAYPVNRHISCTTARLVQAVMGEEAPGLVCGNPHVEL
jgi:hypothetical protein